MSKVKTKSIQEVRAQIQNRKIAGIHELNTSSTPEFTSSLKEFIDKSNHEDYDCTGVIYIDKEVHEVLGILKKKQKAQINKLVSSILSDFILSHKIEIQKLYRTNKFLES